MKVKIKEDTIFSGVDEYDIRPNGKIKEKSFWELATILFEKIKQRKKASVWT